MLHGHTINKYMTNKTDLKCFICEFEFIKYIELKCKNVYKMTMCKMVFFTVIKIIFYSVKHLVAK